MTWPETRVADFGRATVGTVERMKWTTPQGRVDALYSAISAGQSVRVRSLLGVEPGLANSSQRTPPPLHWAVYRNRIRMVQVLLDAGADIELSDREGGSTALDYAILHAREDIVRLLIDRGADTEGRLGMVRAAAEEGYVWYPQLHEPGAYVRIESLLEGLDET